LTHGELQGRLASPFKEDQIESIGSRIEEDASSTYLLGMIRVIEDHSGSVDSEPDSIIRKRPKRVRVCGRDLNHSGNPRREIGVALMVCLPTDSNGGSPRPRAASGDLPSESKRIVRKVNNRPDFGDVR
jgi:hypothetical protein